MKIIEPHVELWSEENVSPESHIAQCARVCYGKEYKEPNQEADEKMVNGLIKRGHLSMLRHASIYLNNVEYIPNYYLKNRIFHSDYWNYSIKYDYTSTNLQEFDNFEKLIEDEYDSEHISTIDNKSFLKECAKNSELFKLYRLTFCITTQISTSRELNRVSPNNIAERSTRFCTQKDGLEIVKPWWWDGDDTGINMLLYKEAVYQAELNYQGMINYGLKPEDARGVLPLDTATKVIYTYSIKEWQHILDLRLYDKTGKAHPNCHVVMQMVKDQINKFAKEHNINYQV